MRLVYNPETNREERAYDCPLCQDRKRIDVPLQGEPWDMFSLYIEGDYAHIHCPDCHSTYELSEINNNMRRHSPNRRQVELDWDYIAQLRRIRRGEISEAERAELKANMEKAMAKFLGKIRTDAQELKKTYSPNFDRYEEQQAREEAMV